MNLGWRRALRQFLRIVVVLLCVLIPFGLDHVMSMVSRDPCKPHLIGSSNPADWVETWIYRIFTESGFRDIRSRSTAVVLLRQRELPQELFSNICKQRPFLASVVRQVGEAGAAQIVIDKYFSPTSCTDTAANLALIDSIKETSVKTPIVIGISTVPRALFLNLHPDLSQTQRRQLDKACLVVADYLDFLNPRDVHQGVLRADADLRKIALAWPVFPTSTLDKPPEVWPSLSAVAATLRDPEVGRRRIFEEDLKRNVHPLTSFIKADKIAAVSAAAVACVAGVHVSGYQCPNPPGDLQVLRGRIVLIGDDSATDTYPTPVGDMPGVFLQANYIESLLDDRYFKTFPAWVEALMALAWVLTIGLWFGTHKTSSMGVLARPFLAAIMILLACSWLAFQITGFLCFFAIPSGAIALGLRCVEKIGEWAS